MNLDQLLNIWGMKKYLLRTFDLEIGFAFNSFFFNNANNGKLKDEHERENHYQNNNN